MSTKICQKVGNLDWRLTIDALIAIPPPFPQKNKTKQKKQVAKKIKKCFSLFIYKKYVYICKFYAFTIKNDLENILENIHFKFEKILKGLIIKYKNYLKLTFLIKKKKS